jgi:Sulfotransferase domain
MTQSRVPLVVYFGHHKCATQWMRRIVTHVCREIGREPIEVNSWPHFQDNLDAVIDDPSSTFLCCGNAEKRYVAQLSRVDNGFRGFHIVRDPRDIVVSAYFSHLYSHTPFEGLAERRARLEAVPKSEGLLLELENRQHEFRAMFEWDYHQPNVLELRMEDATAAAADEVPKIMEFLGLGERNGLTSKRLRQIVADNEFNVLAGRSPGEEDVKAHYRKGVPGDWVNHFEAEHVDYFKQHHGELLIKLGYEKDDNW